MTANALAAAMGKRVLLVDVPSLSNKQDLDPRTLKFIFREARIQGKPPLPSLLLPATGIYPPVFLPCSFV